MPCHRCVCLSKPASPWLSVWAGHGVVHVCLHISVVLGVQPRGDRDLLGQEPVLRHRRRSGLLTGPAGGSGAAISLSLPFLPCDGEIRPASAQVVGRMTRDDAWGRGGLGVGVITATVGAACVGRHRRRCSGRACPPSRLFWKILAR